MTVSWRKKLELKIKEVDKHFKNFKTSVNYDSVLSKTLANSRRVSKHEKATVAELAKEIKNLDSFL